MKPSSSRSRSVSWLRTSLITSLIGGVAGLIGAAGCAPQSATVGGGEDKDEHSTPSDVADALALLPDAQVILQTEDGLPLYIVGELAKVGAVQQADLAAAGAALAPALPAVLAPFRLKPSDLVLRKVSVDEDGGRHFRYAQQHAGLDVIGADLVVHVDVKGALHAVNGTARGDIDPSLGRTPIAAATAVAAVLGDARYVTVAARSTTAPRLLYLETGDGAMHQAFEIVVEGLRGSDPVRDKVYVDVDSGDVVAVHPQIHFAESRKVYSSNNGSTTPGTLKRSEGQAATTDVDVNAAYDNTGAAYEAYKNFWNRDSYDNAGAPLLSSVHYSSSYCNAYWNGTQMVYGDGTGADCLPLARATDVTAHELTHAVTESESALIYSGESGGINEAMSDIFGAFVEAWVDGGKTGTLKVTTDTFLIGEDILPPALRYMCDPAADGGSKDVWTSSVGSADVHYSSGVANLAFCLLTKGGVHPRGKTTVNVPGLGMDKAIRIFYKANTDILTSNANYAALRAATVQAAAGLAYTTAEQDAVGCAWAAVGVGTAPASCGGATPPPPSSADGTLVNKTPLTNLVGAKDSWTFWKLDVPAGQTSLTISTSGGTGDADMFVQLGAKPTATSYVCRPYKNGNAETCTITPPQAGTYWVGLNAYAAFSGLTLTASYDATSTPPAGDPYLASGAATSVAGAANSAQYWRVAAPAGATLTVKLSGGTGDADLYTRPGARPTTTTYGCRPYLTGNNETCTGAVAAAGDTYVMVRGYAAFTGASLVATW
ncbi:MAG: M4 family metallopeptidase [Proteobacteria bacterium]|nr:M4 family metallopeptidase [Pseudomonadota bacterium]